MILEVLEQSQGNTWLCLFYSREIIFTRLLLIHIHGLKIVMDTR